MTYELRTTLEAPGLEVRAESNRLVATGLGIVYGKRSRDLGGFVEEVRFGAATKTIQEADIRALVNHDPALLLGRSGAGTLVLEDRATVGLHYTVHLPDTTLGRDTAKLLERGDYPGSSFGFRTIEDEWGETEDGRPLRTLLQVAIRDIGPVTFPAYDDSTTGLQSLAAKRSMDFEEVRSLAAEGNLIEAIRFSPETNQTKEEGRPVAPAPSVRRRYY